MAIWDLFLDDERNVKDVYDLDATVPGIRYDYTVIRSSADAIDAVKKGGMPRHISFDHDLGNDDTSMVFLKWLAFMYYNIYRDAIPTYRVHSANPVGAKNIESFMESWKKINQEP